MAYFLLFIGHSVNRSNRDKCSIDGLTRNYSVFAFISTSQSYVSSPVADPDGRAGRCGPWLRSPSRLVMQNSAPSWTRNLFSMSERAKELKRLRRKQLQRITKEAKQCVDFVESFVGVRPVPHHQAHQAQNACSSLPSFQCVVHGSIGGTSAASPGNNVSCPSLESTTVDPQP